MERGMLTARRDVVGGDFSRAPCLCKNVKLSSCHHSVSRDSRGLETGKPKPQGGLGAFLATVTRTMPRASWALQLPCVG